MNHLREKHPDHLSSSEVPLPRRRVVAAPEGPAASPVKTAAESQELEDIFQFFKDSCGELEEYAHSEPSAEDQEHDSDVEDVTEEPRGRKADTNGFTPYKVVRCSVKVKAGEPVCEYAFERQRSPAFNHLFPFRTARDYKLARFMVGSKVPKSSIDPYFRDEILPPDIASDISFTSVHTLFKQTERMAQDPKWYSGNVEFPLRPKSEFRYRSILHCIQYLLRQRAFVNNMLWDPIEVFNCEGERIYSEMNTGSWWWEEQVFICIYILECSASINKA